MFYISIPLQVYIDHFYKKRPLSSANGEPTTVTFTITQKPPLWKRLLPCWRASKRRPSSLTPFSATDVEKNGEPAQKTADADTGELQQTDGPKDHPNRSASDHESAPENSDSPPRDSMSPPSSGSTPTIVIVPSSDAEPGATREIGWPGDGANETNPSSLPDVPPEEGHEAERKSPGCGPLRRALACASRRARRSDVSPAPPSGADGIWAGGLKKPRGSRKPRPELVHSRTRGSLAFPWGLQPAPGTVV